MSVERALSITGRTSDDDVRWLAHQAATRRTILEIGPYMGRSTRALADAHRDNVVYALDNWNAAINQWRPDVNARAACHANLADLIASGKVLLLEWNSQDGVPPVLALAETRVDMLWIDGDHSYEGVLSDIRTFAPLVKPGGLVCGHDYSVHHKEVMQAVDEVYGQRVRSLGIHRSIWWIV